MQPIAPLLTRRKTQYLVAWLRCFARERARMGSFHTRLERQFLPRNFRFGFQRKKLCFFTFGRGNIWENKTPFFTAHPGCLCGVWAYGMNTPQPCALYWVLSTACDRFSRTAFLCLTVEKEKPDFATRRRSEITLGRGGLRKASDAGPEVGTFNFRFVGPFLFVFLHPWFFLCQTKPWSFLTRHLVLCFSPHFTVLRGCPCFGNCLRRGLFQHIFFWVLSSFYFIQNLFYVAGKNLLKRVVA